MSPSRSLLAAAALALVAGCARPGPRDLAYGTEPCTHCHMILVDPRYAAQLVTRTGRILPFDDVGCLTAYLRADTATARGGRAWVNDFLHPETRLPADSAVYLRADSLRTPMSSHLAALRPGPTADSLHAVLGGELLTWPALLEHPES